MPEPVGDLLVEMEGISKDFPGVHALRGCRFELRRGEIHALVGENGAGKSTLMKVLAGVYRRDAGRVRLKGADVDIASPRAAQQLGISIIHQELSLMPHLSVAQNIFIGREPRGRVPFVIDERKLNEQARALFDAFLQVLRVAAQSVDLTQDSGGAWHGRTSSCQLSVISCQ